MKKFILVVIAALATTAGAYAMSLKDAFTALSGIPNINVSVADANLPVISEQIQDVRIAGAYNLNREQVKQSADYALSILNQVSLAYLTNGAYNGEVGAFVYTTPNGTGTNDILVVAMSGYKGSVVSLFGTVDDATVEAIRMAPVNMEGSFLSLEAKLHEGDDFNIILSKGR